MTFPVYSLPSGNWYQVDGLLYLNGELVDDRNMPGKTLGARRLQTPFEELVPLSKCIDSIIGVIKQSSKYYIDTKGTPFAYVKTKFCKVKYHKIRRIDLKDVASVLWLEGINSPFTIPRPPPTECKWAGVLYLDASPWLLFDYSDEKLEDARRKI